MEEHKTPQEESLQNEEHDEYSFMQEVIKDETDSATKMKHNIFRMVGYGLVLGVAASVAFCASKPWIEEKFQSSPKQVEIPRDEEEETEEEPVKEEKEEPDSDGYRQVIQSLSTTAANVKNSLVVVSKSVQEEEQEEAVKEGLSGVIIADNGRELLILSNILPVRKNETVQVTFFDKKSYSAKLKKQDVNLGIGVYAVEKNDIDQSIWSKLPAAELGNSLLMENGDTVIVVGKPFGSDLSVSYGIVTADEEEVEKADGHYRLICTNIASEGNGSGVILNKKGQVVGIINQSALGEGSDGRIGGYGISDIKEIIELLSNGSNIPFTGIYGMDVTDKLMKKGMPQGVYVKEVAADSPAMAAGIQSGDVIVGINGENIVSLSNYHSILMGLKSGAVIQLNGCRQGQNDEYVEIDFEVTVGTINKE